MAVKHINQNANIQSDILLSGTDTKKVFSMFTDNKSASYINEKKRKVLFLFATNQSLHVHL